MDARWVGRQEALVVVCAGTASGSASRRALADQLAPRTVLQGPTTARRALADQLAPRTVLQGPTTARPGHTLIIEVDQQRSPVPQQPTPVL